MIDHRLAHLALPFLAATLLSLMTACAPPQRYHYDSIRREYPGASSRMRTTTAVAATTPSAPAAWDTDRPICLATAIELALASNPDRQMAVARMAQAEALISQAAAGFYPTLSISSEYMQGDAPSAYLFKTIDQRRLSPGTDFNQPGWFQNNETGGTIGWNLFNGGRDMLARRMAETGLDISALDRESFDNSLRAAVIHSFYNILAAEDFLAISRQSAATVQEQLRVMQVRYDAGGALKSDILSLEVRLAEAEEDVVQGENRVKTATAALANVLGLDPDSRLTLDTAAPFDERIPETFQEGLTHALAHRPEIHRMRQQVIQSRMAVDLAKSGYLPRIDFQTRWYVDAPQIPDYDMGRDNWTAGVMLNWALFSGFSTRAEERQAKARLMEMLMADQKALQDVQFDVKTAYLRLEESAARRAVARKSIESAEESFSLVTQQYAGGATTITRYLEAEAARNRSRHHNATAAIDYLKATADVCRAIGRWSPVLEQASATNRP